MATNYSCPLAKKTVLCVDDEETSRVLVGRYLSDMGATVLYAGDGKAALDIMETSPVDAVVSDVLMPVSDGIELLRHVKKTKPALPVVLMSCTGQLGGQAKAAELGAEGLLTKPVSRDDLCRLVSGGLRSASRNDDPPGDAANDLFCKLSIEDFVTGSVVKFDVFVRISEGKFVKLVHAGDELPAERIRAFREKGVRFLYMSRGDFAHYLGFNAGLAKKLGNAPHIAREKKLNFIKHTGEIILEQFFLNELDEELFEVARGTVETTVSLLLEMPDMGSLLLSLNEHSDTLYAHSVGVSVYSSLIGRKMGWDNARTMHKLALAGLLHDIGKKELEKSLLQKSRSLMTADEVKAFQSHSQRGAAILAQLRSAPGDLSHIVLHHHENWLGTGWPAGLRKSHIHPLARVISVADEFCHLVVRSTHETALPVLEALERICVLRRLEFDPAVNQALLGVFKPDYVRGVKNALQHFADTP